MKRSEAINLISSVVYELNVEADECDDVSDIILRKLENAGMLPPESKDTDKCDCGCIRETFWDDE